MSHLHPRSLAAALVLALGGTALAQPFELVIPSFGSTASNSSVSRGFWFVAPVDFTITGLRVPDESNQGFQNVEVVRLLEIPGMAAATATNNFISEARHVGVQSGQVIEVNIPILAGDMLGILSAAGTSTMYFSMTPSSTNPWPTTVLGEPTQLRRISMSGNIITAPAQSIYRSDTLNWARTEVFYIAGATVTVGSCCLPDGSCEEIRQDTCLARSGTYHGDNTLCATSPAGGCPQPPTGACCLTDGACEILWEPGCLAQGGTYFGDGTDCTGRTCPHIRIFPDLPHAASNTFPFHQAPGIISHQVFDHALISNLIPGQTITIQRIAFAPSNTGTFNGDLTIRLGYTLALPGEEPAAGGLMVPAAGGGGGGMPNALFPMHEFYSAPTSFSVSNFNTSDFQFRFEGAPFEYDPTLGNLLLELEITSQSGGFSISRAAGGPQASRTHRLASGSTGTQTGQAHRTEFLFSVAGTQCYADCDGNEILNIDDFLCFINAFAQSDPYADCDGNSTFNIDDFLCFINEFAQGCP